MVTKKGDTRPWYDIEASVSAKRRIRADKQKAAVERSQARTRECSRYRPLPGRSIADRMLQAMQPGAWFGMGDIARMAGVDRSARGKVHQVLLRRRWIEKAVNPRSVASSTPGRSWLALNPNRSTSIG
jgi:hypothetical protein